MTALATQITPLAPIGSQIATQALPAASQPDLTVVPDAYALTPSDRALVASAATTFSSDWRYLLDMVQAANRTQRKSPKSPPSFSEVAG